MIIKLQILKLLFSDNESNFENNSLNKSHFLEIYTFVHILHIYDCVQLCTTIHQCTHNPINVTGNVTKKKKRKIQYEIIQKIWKIILKNELKNIEKTLTKYSSSMTMCHKQ